MNKEFTFIYFNEDGGCVIEFMTLQEVNKWLDDIIKDEDGNPLDSIVVKLEKFDSMYKSEIQRYMIIKGLPIIPRVITKIQKLEI